MSARREFALTQLLPKLEILDLPRPIDLRDVLGLDYVIIDFGSGMGDNALELASKSPNAGILAIDVHTVGLCEVAQTSHERNLFNIRTHHGDGIDVLRDWLQPNSISEIQILFPDPWPKARHHKRRLIQHPFLDSVFKLLKQGGIVRFATDDDSYFVQATGKFASREDFQMTLIPWEVPLTTYHQRAIRLGHTISNSSYFKVNPN